MAQVWRVRDRATFAALRSRGRRARRGPLTAVWLDDAPASPPRVAYVAGRTLGSAVARNRVRRRLRAAVADAGLPGGAWLLIASPGVDALSATELRDAVAGVAAELAGAPR